MTNGSGRVVTPGYWIDRRTAWAGSPAIIGYTVSRVMGDGWSVPMFVGQSRTALGARRIIRERQAREEQVAELMAAASRLERGNDPGAAAMIDASNGLLLRADDPIRLADPTM